MTTDAVGGVWTYTLDLGRALVREGYDVVLAVLGPGFDQPKASIAADAGMVAVELGVRPEWLADNAAEVALGGATIAQLARDQSADVIHLNHPALAGETQFNVPVVTVCHSCVATWWDAVKGTPLPECLRWQSEAIQRAYRSADALVAPTCAFADATRRIYGLDRRPIVVHNGRRQDIDPALASPPVEAIVTAGRLWDEGKNVETLDRAAALLGVPFQAAGPTVGPNGASVTLSHLIALGPLPEADIRALFSRRPIAMSAARYEPFGLAVLEAAQAGCALVLSDIPTFRELWNDAALFVSANDAEGYAAAAKMLLSDPHARASAGLAAQTRAGNFTLDILTTQMTALYQSVRMGGIDTGRAA